MPYQEFYKFLQEEYNKLNLLNADEFDKTLADYKAKLFHKKNVKDLVFKCVSYINRNPFLKNPTVDEVLAEAEKSDFFKATLLKQVTRQNKSELQQKTFIENITNNEVKIEILPKSGDNSYRINDDGIIQKGIKKNKTKSLDSIIRYKKLEAFCVQKLTHEFGGAEYTSGGAQNNQENDAVFNTNIMYHDEKLLVILLDGNYYNTKLKGGLSTLEILRNENKNKNVIITNCILIKSDLDDYIINNSVNE